MVELANWIPVAVKLTKPIPVVEKLDKLDSCTCKTITVVQYPTYFNNYDNLQLIWCGRDCPVGRRCRRWRQHGGRHGR